MDPGFLLDIIVEGPTSTAKDKRMFPTGQSAETLTSSSQIQHEKNYVCNPDWKSK